MAKRRRDKKTREREDLIRRSPILSDGSKLLWIELQRGWAWNDSTCCPSQESLGKALGWSVRRVKRRLAELVGFSLISVERDSYHQRNCYRLVDEIPADICDPGRLVNKSFGDQGTESTRGTGQNRPVDSASTGQDCPVAGDSSVPRQGTAVSPKDESTKDELTKDEIEPSGTLSERTTVDHQSGDLDQDTESVSDIDGLLGETEEERLVPNPRTRRGASSSLLDLPHLAPRRGIKTPAGQRVPFIEAEPPPPGTPKDIALLIRSEVQAKYGLDDAHTRSTSLTAKQRGQLKKTVLHKYSPDLILKMIRVLVWDWERVREIWPPRPEKRLPSVDDLVLYEESLSGATTTGFAGTNTNRGSERSYYARYISGTVVPAEADEDPF